MFEDPNIACTIDIPSFAATTVPKNHPLIVSL